MRFTGDCDGNGTIVSGDVCCISCGRRIELRESQDGFALVCESCGVRFTMFSSDAGLKTYLQESWASLRKICSEICYKV